MKYLVIVIIIIIIISSIINGASIIENNNNNDDDHKEFNIYQHLFNLNDNSKVFLIKKKNKHVYFNQTNGKYLKKRNLTFA